MKSWILGSLFVLVHLAAPVTNPMFAQVTDHGYTGEELTHFAVIYTDSKNKENSLDVEIITLLQQYNVTYSRYNEFIRNNIEGKQMPEATENEKLFFDSVKAKNEQLQQKVAMFEMERCKELKLSVTTYKAIKEKFEKSPAFQNQIYPYFEKIINSPRED